MYVFAFEEVSFRVKGNFFEAGSIATACKQKGCDWLNQRGDLCRTFDVFLRL